MTTKALRKLPLALLDSSAPARLWSPGDGGRVTCHLSPRECNIPDGGVGFCGVRKNDGGRLVTLNYGKSVAVTQETIESEAIYHYAPGERILSLGNIGCMMSCDFCHNWQTSQARHARDRDVHVYTPEQVVEYALRHDIRILSWTYNDPVVWHEFVLDTAKLARQAGLKNLYKSAFYIGPRAVDELLEVIDIFSLSLKSMDPEFYRKHTKGRLEPVLAAIRQVYAARTPHLELSNLCITGRNDNLADAAACARWVLDTLDADVPLHYVRFHPDYKYTHVERTSIPFLEEARRQAMAMGLRHVYVGNVYDTASTGSYCTGCGAVLVARRGNEADNRLVDGGCPACGQEARFVEPWPRAAAAVAAVPTETLASATHWFRGGVQALHVEQDGEDEIVYQLIDAGGAPLGELRASSCMRFLVANSRADAAGARLFHAPARPPRVFEVFDRAHFPTVDVATALAPNDQTPLPHVRE